MKIQHTLSILVKLQALLLKTKSMSLPAKAESLEETIAFVRILKRMESENHDANVLDTDRLDS